MYKKLLWLLASIKYSAKSTIAYKTSFAIQVVGMIINDLGFFGVWYLFFTIFKDVNGWQFKEMVGLIGFIALTFGLVDACGSGIRKISRYVTYGQLDRFLVLPKSPLVSAILSESSISAVGDMAFGLVSIIIYFVISDLGLLSALMLIPVMVFALMAFCGFIIVVQSLVFWIPNSDELSGTFFEFMFGPALYPNASFTGAVRIFFTFCIPAIVIGGLPIDILLKPNLKDILTLAVLGISWLKVSTVVFYKGLRRYESGNLVGVR